MGEARNLQWRARPVRRRGESFRLVFLVFPLADADPPSASTANLCMRRLWSYLIEAVQSPGEQLTLGQARVRQAFYLGRYGWRQLQQHRAEGMAAELAYRTIFSLVPLVVLGLVTFRIVGGLDEVQSQVENQLYSFFGVPDIPDNYVEAVTETVEEIDEAQRALADDGPDTTGSPKEIQIRIPLDTANENPPDANLIADGPIGPDDIVGERIDALAEGSDADKSHDRRQVAEAQASIRATLSTVTAKVSTIDFRSIGIVGLLVFIYAAVALADSVEQLFNRIYDAPSGRPIHIRFAIHWSIITLGSGLLAMSLYASSQVVQWFVELGAGSRGLLIISHLLSVLASWVLLFLLYALMPNTHVSVRAAGAGSLVSSLLWEAAKFGFQIYVAKALPYSALYGSIGLIPLFLFWIYVTWLIVLFGLILTQALQTFRGGVPSTSEYENEEFPKGDPDWMLPIMAEIAMAFERGRTLTNQDLADRLRLSGRVVHDLTQRLIGHDLVRRVGVGAGDDEALSLAKPADKISVAEILKFAHGVHHVDQHPAWQTLADLKTAQRDAAGQTTLADIAEEDVATEHCH